MSYTKTIWVNGETPINDTNLNNIEDGVEANDILINELKGVVLWTNPSPSNEFVAQSITLSSSDYDMYEIFYSLDKDNQNDMLSIKSIKGKNAVMQGLRGTASVSPFRARNCTYTDATHLTFSTGYYGTNALTTTSNNYIIPLYVVGYKTGLFT